MEQQGRVAVVTGAARGMGREMVRGLMGEGFRVVAMDRDWSTARDAHDELVKGGALVLSADVTSDADVQAAFLNAIERFGTVDVLVNNAGMRMRDVNPSTYHPVLDSTVAQWRQMLEVNLMAPVRLIQSFSRPMLDRGSGAIINIVSGSGTRGRAGDQPYGASKAALINFTQSLADELKPYGVAVNGVMPGRTVTTGYVEQNALRAQRVGPSAGPSLRPDAIAPLVVFLAGQTGAVITGRILQVMDWNIEHGLGGLETWAATE